MPEATMPPGWYPDPWESAPYRFFDGITWTTQLSDRPSAPEPPEEEAPPVDYGGRTSHQTPSRSLPWLIGLCVALTLALVVGLLVQPFTQTPTSTVPAPTNVRAAPTDGRTITLTWVPGTGGPAVDSFVIQRDGTEVATVPRSVTTYTDRNDLTPASTYRYTVTAVAGSVRSPASAWVAAAPLAPSPAALTVKKTGLTSVALTWTPPEGVDAPDRYQLFRNGTQVDTIPGDTASVTDGHLEPGTAYRYTIAAVWGDNTSPPARELRVTTASPTLAMARLAGTWSVTDTMTRTSGSWPSVGATWGTFWETTPSCETGACAVAAIAQASNGGPEFSIPLDRNGATYSGSAPAQLTSCNSMAQLDTVTIRIKVTKGATIDGLWVATVFRGTLEIRSPDTRVGGVHCKAAVLSMSVSGELGA